MATKRQLNLHDRFLSQAVRMAEPYPKMRSNLLSLSQLLRENGINGNEMFAPNSTNCCKLTTWQRQGTTVATCWRYRLFARAHFKIRKSYLKRQRRIRTQRFLLVFLTDASGSDILKCPLVWRLISCQILSLRDMRLFGLVHPLRCSIPASACARRPA